MFYLRTSGNQATQHPANGIDPQAAAPAPILYWSGRAFWDVVTVPGTLLHSLRPLARCPRHEATPVATGKATQAAAARQAPAADRPVRRCPFLTTRHDITNKHP